VQPKKKIKTNIKMSFLARRRWLTPVIPATPGRDQEDGSSKPAQANSSGNLISKIPNMKRTGRGAEGVGSEFKPQYCKRKKRCWKALFLQGAGDENSFLTSFGFC
jgi:hypothetical protein